MRPSPHHRRSFKLLLFLIAGIGVSHAFEQGSYHIFDLLESADAQPVTGRLAVPATALAASTEKEALPLSPVEHSDFVIDYSEGLQATSNSAFEFNAPEETAKETENTNFSTGTFDFGSSNTVFGE